MDELRRAVRGLRARALPGIFAVALLALALAGSTIVFSTTDSFVFNRVPYKDLSRLVELRAKEAGRPTRLNRFPAELLAHWRSQTNLFSSVQAFTYAGEVFLISGPQPEFVGMLRLTPGFLEMLDVRAQWGRLPMDDDARSGQPTVGVISERLARRQFGDPGRAVGQTLTTTQDVLTIIGVMPADFNFTDGGYDIWGTLNSANFGSGQAAVAAIARLATNVPNESVDAALSARPFGTLTTEAVPYGSQVYAVRPMMLALFGAAVGLLLTACASVASLELAGAISRAQTHSVLIALGASRWSLVRTALLEGLCLSTVATAIAAGVTHFGLIAVAAQFPNLTNPIDFDARSVGFLAATSAVTWLLASLPVVLFVARANPLQALNRHGRIMTGSPSAARARRVLTIAQIALSVPLLVGTLLFARTYLRLADAARGFDTAGVASVYLYMPRQIFESDAAIESMARDIADRIKAHPGVVAVSRTVGVPPSRGFAMGGRLEIEGHAVSSADRLQIATYDVEPDYFETLRIPLRAGRTFDSIDAGDHVIVCERFANAHWPGESPLGQRFRFGPRDPWKEIVGVAGHVQNLSDGLGTDADPSEEVYFPFHPAAIAGPLAPAASSLAQLWFAVRLDSSLGLAELTRTVRAVDPRFSLTVRFVDDLYSSRFDDRRFAMRVVSALGLLALAIATIGVYGVMTFLVASRTREIGIRVALGADQPSIRSLVLRAALRMAGVGAALGAAGAFAASRFVESQLFGVSATDPATYAIVTLGVCGAALVATWAPVRRATRVDPVTALRAE